MPGLVLTLPLQVTGLKTVYLINDDIHFAFESKNALDKARKKAAKIYTINTLSSELLPTAKKTVFSFSISFASKRAIRNFPLIALVQSITERMLSGRLKEIPIVTIKYD